MNHSKNITNIGAALGTLLAALTTRSEEPVILPEITVTGSTATDTGYRADTATTATKTDTPIFDLPVSIQVVPRELMDDDPSSGCPGDRERRGPVCRRRQRL